jgi:hypothetical protein
MTTLAFYRRLPELARKMGMEMSHMADATHDSKAFRP